MDIKLDYDDILITPRRSTVESRSDVDLFRTYRFPHYSNKITCVGIIAANMWNIGCIDMAKALAPHGIMTAINKFASDDELVQVNTTGSLNGLTFITIGQSEDELNKISIIGEKCHKQADIFMNKLMICIDVANGYRTSFLDFVKKVRTKHPCIIMAGNVTTPEAVEDLIKAGADIVKIGIGPGSACDTRKITGVGYPMVSSVLECGQAAHEMKGLICADGGCKTPGDVAKAFVCGADFVMLGGMFAGCEECQGEWTYKKIKLTVEEFRNRIFEDSYGEIEYSTVECIRKLSKESSNVFKDVKDQLKFFGMSSGEAMKRFGGEKSYRTSEGRVSWVDYKGPAANVVNEILGGLRSCGTYIDARKLEEFPLKGSFVRISR